MTTFTITCEPCDESLSTHQVEAVAEFERAHLACVDDEKFCPKCFAGLESSEHREKCGGPA